MRTGLIAAGLSVVPMLAMAEMPASAKDWHLCATDYDCVVVPGVCGEAAVNKSVQEEATAYYREQAKTAKCPSMFWKPQTGIARCRLEWCEVATQKE